MTIAPRKDEFSGTLTEMPCGCSFDTPWEGQTVWNTHTTTCDTHRDHVDFVGFKKAMRSPEDAACRRAVEGFNARFLAEMRAGYATLGNRIPTRGAALLTTIGARTGVERTLPLSFQRAGTTFSLMATNGGQDRHPAWYRNILAHPEVKLEIANHVFVAHAREVHGAERDYLIAVNVHARPTHLGMFERAVRLTRQVPIIMLTPERDDLPFDDELIR